MYNKIEISKAFLTYTIIVKSEVKFHKTFHHEKVISDKILIKDVSKVLRTAKNFQKYFLVHIVSRK